MPVNIWGNAGTDAARILHKGDLAYIEGSVDIRQYEHQGAKRESISVRADSWQLLTARSKQESAHPDRRVEKAKVK